MSKKVLSFLLIAAILLTSTLFSGVFATAETETKTWSVGDRPYAVPGKSGKIEVYEASSATFYDDFVIPSAFNFDKATVSLQLNSGLSVIKDGEAYVWYEKATETEGVNENAYGGIGNSVKLTMKNICGVQNKYDGDYYNSIRYNGLSFDCTAFPSFDDIAVAFWVKTENAAKFSAAFWDTYTTLGNVTQAAQKIYSDYISVPEAGEYIVVLPLSSFYVVDSAYVKNEDISTFKMQSFELMFKPIGLSSGETTDIYIDNLGIYAIKPNFKPAYTSEIANVVDDFNDYTQTATKTVTSASNAGLVWNSTDGSACSSVDVINNKGDRSIVYNASSYLVYSSSSHNSFQAIENAYEFKALDKSGVSYGKDGTLAFYVKASRATTLTIRTNTMSFAWSNWVERKIPAGESIIRIPLTEFGDTKDLTRIRKIQIYFGSTAPTSGTIGGTAGTFEIDDIAFEPTFVEGDINNDKVCDILDIVTYKEKVDYNAPVADVDFYADSKADARDGIALRNYLLGNAVTASITPAVFSQDSFVENNVSNMNNWVNKTATTLSLNYRANPLYYYTGTADTSALEAKYSALSSSGNAFYYNTYLNTPYSSDSVLSFWVYSEQSVNLVMTYMDLSNTTSKNVQCKSKTVTIPAGESLVEIPMTEMAPDGHEMAYVRAFQFQIAIRSNTDSVKTSGTVYFDSFGFYDKDTTNNIPAAE